MYIYIHVCIHIYIYIYTHTHKYLLTYVVVIRLLICTYFINRKNVAYHTIYNSLTQIPQVCHAPKSESHHT